MTRKKGISSPSAWTACTVGSFARPIRRTCQATRTTNKAEAQMRPTTTYRAPKRLTGAR